MRREKSFMVVLVTLCLCGIAGISSGCSSTTSGDEYGPGYRASDQGPADETPPSDEDIRAQQAETATWDCRYDPTMNRNWHDDILCTRGFESKRPILLEGQFVTEDDMIAAGEEYEAELNAAGG